MKRCKHELGRGRGYQLTQGQRTRAARRNAESDNEVRAWRVGVHESGTVSPELQYAVDDLHHLRGVRHGPVQQKQHRTL